MNVRRSNLRLITKALLAIGASALLVCCGDPKYQPPAIGVTFSPEFPPPTVLDTGAYAGIAAVVTNDLKNTGVIFSCTPDQNPGECGSFTPNPTGSNVPTCYLAPDSVPNGNTVTVTATSVSDSTKSISATITIQSDAAQPCP